MIFAQSVARTETFRGAGHLATILAILMAFLLSGCATLPTSAPTSKQIEAGAKELDQGLDFNLVDIDAATALTPPSGDVVAMLQLEALSTLGEPVRADTIRIGDTLSVSIFEVGISLFASPLPTAGMNESPVATAQVFTLHVTEDGEIELPYLGSFQASGTYPEALAKQIKSRLSAFSESPEVMISITGTVENVAYVSGTVGGPGRYRLTSARERLLDVLALAGGPTIDIDDAEIRILREDKVAVVALNELHAEDLGNITVLPGDRIEIRKRRRTFTVFGATDRVSQMPFESRTLSLAEAMARAGGPADTRANPRGVFLFRFQKVDNQPLLRPVIFRLNLMEPESYFFAQQFQMQDKDVLLFANADANLPSKLIGVINQLFSPLVTARLLTQ